MCRRMCRQVWGKYRHVCDYECIVEPFTKSECALFTRGLVSSFLTSKWTPFLLRGDEASAQAFSNLERADVMLTGEDTWTGRGGGWRVGDVGV